MWKLSDGCDWVERQWKKKRNKNEIKERCRKQREEVGRKAIFQKKKK